VQDAVIYPSGHKRVSIEQFAEDNRIGRLKSFARLEHVLLHEKVLAGDEETFVAGQSFAQLPPGLFTHLRQVRRGLDRKHGDPADQRVVRLRMKLVETAAKSENKKENSHSSLG
jgi:hypothetical protein